VKILRALAIALAVALASGASWAQDGDLPPGHPSVGDTDDAPANPHGDNPHGDDPRGDADADDNPHDGPHGKNPHRGDRGGDSRVFTPPPDGSQDDPSMKRGALAISIRDAEDKPIPGAPVVIEVLHSTVAKGDSRERIAKTANDAGELSLEGVQFGSGTTYRVSTTRGGATFALPPFALGDQVGKRAVLHAYEATANLEELLIGVQAVAYLALRDDTIQVEQLITVHNVSAKAWLADATIKLPQHFKAFNTQESSDEARAVEVSGEGVALRGTFAPGRHDLDFRYQIPLDDTERQSLRISLPPHVFQARVMVEAGKSMSIDVANFPPAQREPMNGKHVLVTETAATLAAGGVRTMDITINGLPTPGPGRWIAVGLAVIAIAAGLWTMLQRSDGDGDPEARKDLEEARETLLEELLTLERMHKNGEIGPKTYARVHASLLDALARVVDQIARSGGPKKKVAPARAARGAA
jgi:hypothetical protein